MIDSTPSRIDLHSVRLPVLGVLNHSSAEQISMLLAEEGWTVIRVSATADLAKYNPRLIRCILIDSSRTPLAEEVLEFCELSDAWRNLPKVMIAPPRTEFTNLMRIPPTAVPDHLVSYLRTSQVDDGSLSTTSATPVDSSDRRRHYRHRCSTHVPIRQFTTIIDISSGGAALEMTYGLPPGTKLLVPVCETEPLLKLMESEVLSSNLRRNHKWVVHVRFMNITPLVERAMQRHILNLQLHKKDAV